MGLKVNSNYFQNNVITEDVFTIEDNTGIFFYLTSHNAKAPFGVPFVLWCSGSRESNGPFRKLSGGQFSGPGALSEANGAARSESKERSNIKALDESTTMVYSNYRP
jgi:hypothetical protein